jgi:hypothetical protein
VNVGEAALWAIIAICLVLVGAAPVLAGIVTVLFAIGWRLRKKDSE